MGRFKIVVDTNDYVNFFAFGSDSTHYYQFGLKDDGVTINWWNATNDYYGSVLTVGRWYHIAGTLSGTSGNNFLGYVNGVLDVTGVAASITGSELRVGSPIGGGTDYLNGNAAAIKIYDRVLTAAEIAAEVPWILPYNWAGLNSCYPMLTGWDILRLGLDAPRGDLRLESDWSGNGRHWTVGGTVSHDLPMAA
jgi:hypothetical protein